MTEPSFLSWDRANPYRWLAMYLFGVGCLGVATAIVFVCFVMGWY